MPNGPQLFNILSHKLPGPPRWPFRMRRGHPQSRALVSWWPLVPAHGSAAVDFAGGAVNGLLASAGDPLTYKVNNRGVPVVGFDGNATRHIEFAEAVTGPLELAGPLTVCAWCFPNVTNARALFTKTIGGVVNTGYLLFNDGGSKWKFRVKVSAGTVAAEGPADSAVPNVTQHVCGTYDLSDIRIYKDGIQLGETAETGAVDTGTGIARIGHLASSFFPWDGLIWDVRVYKRALSATEVFQLQDPDTCYDLYEEYGQRTYIFPAHFPPVAGAPAAGNPYYAYAQQ